ncbi:SDR family oxidoreductase [Promicromonospora iranensis]|uniref:3-oxoacyl-[acyl-carrier protein] reductase n=1 Tax=Promicromonospora iranensis TaxID=1105144 RepID=A0ABU2CLV0_9MICO|nr:SDR family oxidoreductase [Promicromonospora iranensis]MDR7382276.1 3-oxoacyl-[acyl-carrier protein] reductase [Promicromonospora iranensis]
MSSTSRVAVVTGGSRGIGRAVTRRLAAAGYDVAVVHAVNQAEAAAAVKEIEVVGRVGRAYQADVADASVIEQVFGSIEEQFGGTDVVVNSAGIMPLAPVAALDLAVLDRLLRTNVRGAFVVAQQAARRVRDGGAVVLFSSTATRLHLPAYGAYAATKGAVEALVPVLAKELAGRNITVNAVAPGPTATDLFLDGKSQEAIDQIARANPMGRLGTPEEIAEVVRTLADRARWINGQTVFVNGGFA